MPWKELRALDLRTEMLNGWLSQEYSITELSESYSVSRKTIYKWIERYLSQGKGGLAELSREPHHHPNATPEEVVKAILAVKKCRMRWGPRKVMAKLRSDNPTLKWPADSTAHEILKRYGFVRPRKYRHHTPPYTEPFLERDQPNRVWSADYKGHFRMGDGRLCYPLTISDNHSRYLLGCWGLTRPTLEQTQPCFEWVFRHMGLPDAIRTDNGVPFASIGLGGLSRLSVWFIKLGIRPERIEAGCPEQNGRHERMHRTLKESTASPPKRNMQEQQKAFNRFLDEYNSERPHEALGQKPPASVYRPSLRPCPAKLLKVEYDTDTTVRYVHTQGYIKWHSNLLFLSETLIGEYVALKPIDNHLWEVSYTFYPLGILDEEKGKITSY
jgi:transposase InsO family protein